MLSSPTAPHVGALLNASQLGERLEPYFSNKDEKRPHRSFVPARLPSGGGRPFTQGLADL